LGLPVIENPSHRGERMVWSVAALVNAVSDALAARFSACTIRGEVSGFSRASSGHCYLSLKDAQGGAALIRCAMFRAGRWAVG
jgi:exodeoxyribonuclease VII large subunit